MENCADEKKDVDEGYYGSSEIGNNSIILTTETLSALKLQNTPVLSTTGTPSSVLLPDERNKTAKLIYTMDDGKEILSSFELNQVIYVWSMSPRTYGDLLLFLDPVEIQSISRNEETIALKTYFNKKFKFTFSTEDEAKGWSKEFINAKKARETDVLVSSLNEEGKTFSEKYILQAYSPFRQDQFIRYAKNLDECDTFLCKFLPVYQAEHVVLDTETNEEIPVEILALKSLVHPGIVKLLDCFASSDFYIIVFDYDEANIPQDLHAIIDDYSAGEFPLYLAEECVRQIADALVYIHSSNWIHGDIKDENILVKKKGDDFHFCLIDFGSAFPDRHTGPYKGTVNYMPPEETTLSNNIDYAAFDIYAFGRMVLVMLFGGSVQWKSWLDDARQSSIEQVRERGKSLDSKWINFIHGTLETDPGKRLNAIQIKEVLF